MLKQSHAVNPFQLKVLEATDDSETCIGLDGAYWCASGGRVREAKLELQVARWERREDRIRPVYRLKAYAEGARKYVAVL